jgi:hydroxyacylglutathione hydrolase
MKTITVPCHYDNYAYIVICEKSKKAAIIDPAEYYPLLQILKEQDAQLTAIYCTHHHADHIGGLEEFLGDYAGLNVYGHYSDSNRIVGLNVSLEDGDLLSLGELEGKVIHTPGHTSGSVCYLFEDAVFTGDSVFGGGCGRLFEGSPELMYQSLSHLVAEIPESAEIYFGHEYTMQNLKFALFVEPENNRIARRMSDSAALLESGGFTTPSTLSQELATNPFLRCSEMTIRKNVAEKLFADNSSPQAVFAALRKKKDSF